MYILGIESTAHTFGIAVLKQEKKKTEVLANEKESFTSMDKGMTPSEVSNFHVNNCDSVIKKALEKSKINIKDVGLIAFSQSPGIGHTLRIGAFVARTLAVLNQIPIVGVNHCIAHLEIGNLFFNVKDPVLLYASGANTQIIAYAGKKYRIFGETLDIGIGNFLDSCARLMGFGFPGGPKIYEASLKGKNYIKLPYVVKGMDVSFGGILTNIKQKLASEKYDINDLCYSIQETVFAMLMEVTERAVAHCDKKELLLGGGVACNKRLQEMAKIMCKERGVKCYIPENQYLVDNAAMIGWLGLKMFKKKHSLKIEETQIYPYERTDDVEVFWR
jgi:N6-L-threonylcarbamoyladenine synthase